MLIAKEYDLPWRLKCHRIINDLCFKSWMQANVFPNGKKRKKHVPYSVPDLAKTLIECLNKNDEVRAKQIFLYEAYYI